MFRLDLRSLALALLAGFAPPLRAQDVATDSVQTVPASAGEVDAAKSTPVLREVAVEGTRAAAGGKASEGYKVDTVSAGALGGVRRQDLPYTVSATPAAFIENLQAGNPTDALRYDPAVNPEMGSNRTGDYFAIRGFVNSGSRAIDGVRDETSSGSLEDKERVEVLSGASGLLYGLASPAGIVNYVLKRPTSERLLQLKLGDYGGEQFHAHADAGGPVGASFGYRLNLLGVADGQTAVDKEKNPRELASLALDWRPTEWSKWSVDASYFHKKTSHLQAFFLVGKATEVPDAPDASINYSAPFSEMENTHSNVGSSLRADPAPWISLRAAVHAGNSKSEYQGVRDSWVNNDGDYTQQMYYYKAPNKTDAVQGNAFVDLKGATGPVDHKLTLGYLVDRIEGTSGGTATKYWTTVHSLDNPGDSADPGVNRSQASFVTSKTLRQTGVAVDQVSLGSHVKVLGGLAWAAVHDQGFSSSTGAKTSDYDQGAFTPGAALSVLPVPAVTAYVSFLQALEQGPVAPSTASNAGEQLAPYRSNQVEVGVKTSFGGFAVNAAVFRIEKANAYNDSSVGGGAYVYTEDGRQVNAGAELSFSGKVLPDLTLLGGASILDASIEKTNNAALKGKSPQAVPEELARLFAEYSTPWVAGLALNGGLSYTGEEWVNDANTISIPAVVTADAGIRYTRRLVGKEVTARVTVSNLAGENYWTTKGGSMLYLGSPRTVAASLSVKI
jgi:iron complex outermembrane recepter protein